MLIPSTLDDTLAPPGTACREPVLPARRAGAAGDFPGGSSWDDHKDEVADLMIETVERLRAEFQGHRCSAGRCSRRSIWSAPSGSSAATSFTAQLSLDQIFSARPMLGHADYRAPIPGLYMCGSGTHPGGGVTGAPGHNAAREILRDAKRRRAATSA